MQLLCYQKCSHCYQGQLVECGFLTLCRKKKVTMRELIKAGDNPTRKDSAQRKQQGAQAGLPQLSGSQRRGGLGAGSGDQPGRTASAPRSPGCRPLEVLSSLRDACLWGRREGIRGRERCWLLPRGRARAGSFVLRLVCLEGWNVSKGLSRIFVSFLGMLLRGQGSLVTASDPGVPTWFC